MILDDILSILKNKSNAKAYTIGEKSYTYAELYKYVANIYAYLLEKNKEKKPVVVYGHKEIYMKAIELRENIKSQDNFQYIKDLDFDVMVKEEFKKMYGKYIFMD